MEVIQTSVFSVLKRFPDRKDSIKDLFRKSETFQILCEDYRQCIVALKHWDASQSEEAQARGTEYSALMEELEQEILNSLIEYAKKR